MAAQTTPGESVLEGQLKMSILDIDSKIKNYENRIVELKRDREGLINRLNDERLKPIITGS